MKPTVDAYGRVTGANALIESDIPNLRWTKITNTPTTVAGYGITDAAPLSHVTDDAKHLTATQNSWIDAITASSAEVNQLVGVTSNIQHQIDGKLSLTGGTLSGNLLFAADKYISFIKNSDYGKLYFDSLSDTQSSLVAEIGDNGDESFIVRSVDAYGGTGIVDLLTVNRTSLKYKTADILTSANYFSTISMNANIQTVTINPDSVSVIDYSTIFAGISDTSTLIIDIKVLDPDSTSRTYNKWINSEAAITYASGPGSTISVYNDFQTALQVKIIAYKVK